MSSLNNSHKNLMSMLLVVSLTIIGAFYVLSSRDTEPSLVPTPTAAPELKTVVINEVSIPVEIVDTPEAMRLGLGERDNLPEQNGMLFVYPKKQAVGGFWMKGMRFPLDIIWIADGEIVQIDDNVPFEGGEQVFRVPNDPVNYVLEVNAGFAERNNIIVGDSVVLPD